jgi:hypothetical protein
LLLLSQKNIFCSHSWVKKLPVLSYVVHVIVTLIWLDCRYLGCISHPDLARFSVLCDYDSTTVLAYCQHAPWTFTRVYFILFVAGCERGDMGSLHSWCTFPCQGDYIDAFELEVFFKIESFELNIYIYFFNLNLNLRYGTMIVVTFWLQFVISNWTVLIE